MILRIAIAVLGAVTITIAILLGMDAVTTVFRDYRGEHGYRISDVVIKDRSGRPERPEPPSRMPALPDEEPQLDLPEVTTEAPAAPNPSFQSPQMELEQALDPDQPAASDN